MNSIQRITLAAGALGAIAIVFLHNPTTGYDGQLTFYPDTRGPQEWHSERKECAADSLESFNRLSEQAFHALAEWQANPTSTVLQAKAESLVLRKQKLWGCISTQAIPVAASENSVFDWRSKEPVVRWFGSLANVAWSLVCLAALIAVTYAFAALRTPAKSDASQETPSN